MSDEPDFGSWLRLRRVALILVGGCLLMLITVALPSPWVWIALPIGLLVVATGLFLLYVYYEFHDRGGGMQRKLWRLTLDHLPGYGELSGTAVDIGTGNGSLAIISATENPALQVTGIDLWEPEWEYSIDDCQVNADCVGVTDRCTFLRASAAALPYPDASFDHAMSHFVFHEVTSACDKRAVVKEALRVLKPGGGFSFHDMFFNASLYGTPTELLDALRESGVQNIELVDTRQAIRTPFLLKSKRILGQCAIIRGRK